MAELERLESLRHLVELSVINNAVSAIVYALLCCAVPVNASPGL